MEAQHMNGQKPARVTMQGRLMRRGAHLAVLLAAFSPSTWAGAAERPVSIGVNANFEQNYAQSAHLGWSRLDILWSTVNPSPGVWDFSFTDAQINNAVGWGQQILGILHGVPQWAGGGTGGDNPPLTTVDWAEFARQVALRYRGKIAAYEIWNEPDWKSRWTRNIEQPPLYVDFVHAAAVQIRAQAPGTLIVAPAFLSNDATSGAPNRKQRILQQIQAASYPDGPGPNFVDVLSFHNNANDTEPSANMSATLYYSNLSYVESFLPSMRNAPIWVTEFGWRFNAVGEQGQREKICNEVRNFTGRQDLNLASWNIQRAFIYVLKQNGSSASILHSDHSPLPVITQYLRYLPFPAVQNPAVAADAPSCSSPPPPLASMAKPTASPESLLATLARKGLRDPRAAVPGSYQQIAGSASQDGRSVDVSFSANDSDFVTIHMGPSLAEDSPWNSLTDVGVEWWSSAGHILVSGRRGGRPLGHDVLHEIALALDPRFDDTCVIETVAGTDAALRSLGFSRPASPKGFADTGATLEITRPSTACRLPHVKAATVDFVWTFTDAMGETIKAGIYRYGGALDATPPVTTELSRNWSDKAGNRYWVAASAGAENVAGLQQKLDRVARSMDSAYSR
jgi:hypothetical protein